MDAAALVGAQVDPVRSSSSAPSHSSKQPDTSNSPRGSDGALGYTVEITVPESSDLISLDLEDTAGTSGNHNKLDLIVDQSYSE